MDNSIIPQNEPDDTLNLDEVLRQFSVNGDASPHGDDDHVPWEDTPPDDEDAGAGTAGDAAPSYWRRQFHTLSAFLQRPDKVWHVDRILGAQDFVILYGESGHGKTHTALDLAFSCATGRTFANTFTVARPLTVAYATGEGGSGLAGRLRAVVKHYGTDELPLYIFADIPQLFDKTLPNGALAFLREWQDMATDGLVPAQLDVLILDTLHNATAGADENSAKDAGIVQASMRMLRDALGCAIVLVHHAGKDGAKERGSSAIRASADAVLRATKTGNAYALSCEKLKDGETWTAQAFSLVCPQDMPDGVRVSWDGDVKRENSRENSHVKRLLAYLQENAGEKFTADEVGDATGLPRSESTYVYNALKRLADAGTLRREKDKLRGSVYVYWSE